MDSSPPSSSGTRGCKYLESYPLCLWREFSTKYGRRRDGGYHRSILTAAHLHEIGCQYAFPSSAILVLPRKGDRACFPPLSFMTIYEDHLVSGLRVPIPSIYADIYDNFTEGELIDVALSPHDPSIEVVPGRVNIIKKKTPSRKRKADSSASSAEGKKKITVSSSEKTESEVPKMPISYPPVSQPFERLDILGFCDPADNTVTSEPKLQVVGFRAPPPAFSENVKSTVDKLTRASETAVRLIQEAVKRFSCTAGKVETQKEENLRLV